MSYYDQSYDDPNYWDYDFYDYEGFEDASYDYDGYEGGNEDVYYDTYEDTYEDTYYDADEYYEDEGYYQDQSDSWPQSQNMRRGYSSFNNHDLQNSEFYEGQENDWDNAGENSQDYERDLSYDEPYYDANDQYDGGYQDTSHGGYVGDGQSGQSWHDGADQDDALHSTDNDEQTRDTFDPSTNAMLLNQASIDEYGQRADEPRRIRPYLRQLFFSKFDRRKSAREASASSSPFSPLAGESTPPFLSPLSPTHNTSRTPEPTLLPSPVSLPPTPSTPAHHTVQAHNLLWGGSTPSPIIPMPEVRVTPAAELPGQPNTALSFGGGADWTAMAKHGERRRSEHEGPGLMGFLAPRTS